jgi:hypothetical protein
LKPFILLQPLKALGYLAMQNALSLSPRVPALAVSTLLKTPKFKISSETQGELLAMSPCKIKNKLNSPNMQ